MLQDTYYRLHVTGYLLAVTRYRIPISGYMLQDTY